MDSRESPTPSGARRPHVVTTFKRLSWVCVLATLATATCIFMRQATVKLKRVENATHTKLTPRIMA